MAGSPMTFHGGGEDGKELLRPEFGIITEKWMAENAILQRIASRSYCKLQGSL
jgi:hypothetical protein